MKNQNLLGTWKFTRHIVDNMAGVKRNATGELTITENEWNETGEMDGGDFFQSYKLNMENNFTVSFNDGRLFYELENINEKQTISHLCGDDLYEGIWELNNNNLFIQWIVKGKTKDYIMKTEYKK